MIGSNSFGHTGRGGPLDFVDAKDGIAFGYAMNNIIGASQRRARTVTGQRIAKVAGITVGIAEALFCYHSHLEIRQGSQETPAYDVSVRGGYAANRRTSVEVTGDGVAAIPATST
ncbi:hypothetical protein [Streptomyces javensis]|uniref:hypothetical protein n=1 Tax=Streptomyces javensis TaxID=114698 RepID=UPI00338747EB